MKPDANHSEASPPDQSSGAAAGSAVDDAGLRSQQQRQPYRPPPSKPPFQPPLIQQQQQQQPTYRPGPNGPKPQDGGQAFFPSQGRLPTGGGRMPSFNGLQGGGYRPDLHNARRPSQRANGSPALNNGGFMAGGGGVSGNGQLRNNVSSGGMFYGAGSVVGDGSYGKPLAGNPYCGPPGGWYSPSQLPLRFSPSDSSVHSAQDGSSVGSVFSPSALSSPAQSTSTSPAASAPFAFNPYAPPNPYAMPPNGSPHHHAGYFVPPPVPQGMYTPSGPSSSIDSEPSSPAPGSSSTASSSSHAIQGHNGQTWVYVPVQMSGYYGQPGSIAFSGGPLLSSDGSFSSQGGQGPQMPIYSSSPHAPYGFQPPQPPQPPNYNPQQAQQQHTLPFYSSQQHQQQQFCRPRAPLAPASAGAANGLFHGAVPSGTVMPMSASNGPTGPQSRGAGPNSSTPTPSAAGGGGRRPGLAMRSGNNSPAPTRKAWHPAPPAQRSEWVMWCGNVPSDATQDELWRFFTGPLSKRPVSSHGSSPKAPSTILDDTAETLTVAAEAGEMPPASPVDPSAPVPFDGECEVASVFLIARSSCCFVNYRSQEALDSAISRFNGLPIRPLEGPRSLRLVCRVRRKEDDLKAGVGGQRGRGVHKDWVKDKQAQALAVVVPAFSPMKTDTGESGGDSRAASGLTAVATTPQSHRGSTISSQASTDSSFLARYFPIRYFILKSLTQVDLDTSLKTGLWATQPHNEPVLDQAFRTSKEVVLIFGANKTGEFFGYAKMAGPIKKGVSRLSWASRSSAPLISPTASTTGLSPTGATHPTHPSQQRSAPSMIAEGSEDESAEHPRATTHPSSAKPPFFRTSASQSSVSRHGLQDSPGEITTGSDYIDTVASLSLDDEKPVPSTTPNSLLGRKAADVDRASTPRNSAPAALGAAELESQQRETAINIARQLSHGSDGSSPPRTLSETETAAIISQVGKASAEGSADHTPLSPPKFAQAAGSHPELPTLGRDGVRRVDHAPRVSSAGGELNTDSAGSGPSAASFTGSSAGASSSRSFPFPNEHLPATPEAKTEPLSSEKAPTGEDEGETWGTPFNVEWLQTRRLPFYRVKHLRNPWNQNREIKVSRDGTEIEPDVGRQLLNIWNTSPASASEGLPTSPLSSTNQGDQFSSPISFTFAKFSQIKAVGSEPDVLGLGLSTPMQSGSKA